MIYLLDANVLINANNLYYPIDRVPEYWDWLLHMCKSDKVKMPLEIFEEVKDGPDGQTKDLLYAWIQNAEIKKSLILKEEFEITKLQHVVNVGYAKDLTDDEVPQLGRDPFLIAYALNNINRCVVTAEISNPEKKRKNRKIPDVCKSLGVRCCDPFALSRLLGFSTNWKSTIQV
jgi:hypothetical protein